jgi:hypothetical protein
MNPQARYDVLNGSFIASCSVTNGVIEANGVWGSNVTARGAALGRRSNLTAGAAGQGGGERVEQGDHAVRAVHHEVGQLG